MPVLKIPAGSEESVRDAIRVFVAQRLGSDEFTVQLWEGAGFIDVGTYSAGAFTIEPAAGRNEPEATPNDEEQDAGTNRIRKTY